MSSPRFDADAVLRYADEEGIALFPFQRDAIRALSQGNVTLAGRGRNYGWHLVSRLIEKAVNEQHA